MKHLKSPQGPVAVIGAGVTGASWAGLFAAHGRRVHLFDSDKTKLDQGNIKALQYAAFLADQHLTDNAMDKGKVRPLTVLSEAVQEACFVQECVFETYEAKQAVFKAIDRHAPQEAIIATSSSGLSISKIQIATRFPDRCVAGHPYNPPHLIPLVEVAPGKRTSQDTVEMTCAFYLSVGKTPVKLTRDIPGYLANRMSAALWREAINLVLDGVATVEDVDKAISLGPGLRWAVMGPHLLYHLGGGKGGIEYHTKHLRATKEGMLRDLKDWKTFPPQVSETLAKGLPGVDKIEDLSEQRDQKLLEIIRALHKRK
ncbi:MAG: hypothetical protein KJP07_07140 [Desulfatitalea sp.]|nr:hypothetical protein [Desulfatitalea sp.]